MAEGSKTVRGSPLAERSRQLKPLLLTLLVVGLVLLRAFHLDADTPRGIDPSSPALYVDEGYKTLSAHNLVLFGKERWNAADNYQGWMKRSPITQWSFWLSFRTLGVHVTSARIVSIAYFAVLLAAFVGAMYRRYQTGTLIVGAIALGIESHLFFFSRAALFEIPIAAVLYLLLFALPWLVRKGSYYPVVATAFVGSVLTFGVKASALIYTVPVLIAMAVHPLLCTHGRLGSTQLRLLGFSAIAVVMGAALTARQWLGYLGDPIWQIGRDFVYSPSLKYAFPVVALGLSAAAHGVLFQPSVYLLDPYRLALIALITAGPLLLAIFDGEFRFFVPLLPAYFLIALEWLHLRSWANAQQEQVALSAKLVSFGLVALTLVAYLVAIDNWFGGQSLLSIGIVVIGVAMVAAWYVIRFRRVLIGSMAAAALLLAVAALALVQSVNVVGQFLFAPGYQAAEFREKLMTIVAPDESIGGDWAPFLALGTARRSLYINNVYNSPSKLREVRPTYFLHTEPAQTPALKLSNVRALRGVQLGSELASTTYNDRVVTLYRVRYGMDDAAQESNPFTRAWTLNELLAAIGPVR